MQYIKERELELNNLKKENYILIEENRKLKNEIEKAKAFFEERDIIASRMKKIKEEKLEYFNLFLKFCKESVISLDSDLRIIYSSDSFYKMLGSEESMNVDGQYAYDVYSKYRGEENAKEFCDLCRECLETNETIERQIKYKSPIDGSIKYTTIGISPATNKNGELQNLVIILKDVTEFYKMKERAEDATKAKTDFLANMSHEIRTPMNAIVGMVELIMREDISDIVREHVYNIKSASTNLLGIINDILDISKVEYGKVELTEDEYEFASIINDITNMAIVRIDEKDIEFLVEVDPNIPYKLYGDEIRLRQIIINLVNNAIKFTKSGYVKLKITSSTKDNNKITLNVSVEDSGIGIKSKDLDKLFESFKQVDTRRNRNIEGTGLGLAISKSLIELMGGSISVFSEYGKGSTFSFTLDQKITNHKGFAQLSNDKFNKNILVYEESKNYRKSLYYTFTSLGLKASYCGDIKRFKKLLNQKKYDYVFASVDIIESYKDYILDINKDTKLTIMLNRNEVYHIMENVTAIQKPLYSLPIAAILNDKNISLLYAKDCNEKYASFIAPEAKILIVDDNAVNLKVACGFMSQYEMQIDTANSGYEAINKVTNKKYDLIFMDHMMPEMDGIDTTKAIRSITGSYYKNVPIVALTANAISGAREMFLSNSMQDFLSKPIDTKKLNNILKRWISDKLKQSIGKKDSIIDCDKDIKLINLELEDIDYKLSMFKNGLDINSYIDILKTFYNDGKEKINKLNYYSKEELKRYTIEVHAIKSSSASIGAYTLSEKAKILEDASRNGDILTIQNNHNDFIKQYNSILDDIKKHLEKIKFDNDIKNKETNCDQIMDKDLFYKYIDEIKTAIDNFESDLAIELLNKIKDVKLDKDNKIIIEETLELINMFKYDEALECISKLNKDILNTNFK